MKKTEILQNIEKCEKENRYNDLVDSYGHTVKHPVSPDYNYIKTGFWNKIGCTLSVGIFNFAGTIIAPYCRLKVVGKENLKNIKSGAIATVNHINMIDSVLVKKALKHKKLKITVAEFNNYGGLFGKILRGAGTMPFSSSITAMKHLSQGITYYLQQNNFILFYPEATLWWCYEKPRPLLDGAYFYATKNNTPIVPMFFTFKNLRKRKNGTYRKKFILHIGQPIYPKENLTQKENIAYLKNANFEYNKKIYEEFYNKKLEYINNK